MARVVLFDIDGTLVRTGGAGRRAMDEAFDHITGRDEGLRNVRFAGMTDRSILRAGFEGCGLEMTDARFDQVIADYLVRLARYVPISDGFEVKPGVREAIVACRDAGHALGLGTGNVRPAAMIKLGHGDLAHHFSFGGFGSDAEDRAELLRVGARRGFDVLGNGAEVVVIGDTPLDVAAARKMGAVSVAVATGSFSVAELTEAQPTFVFPTLEASGAVEAILG